MNNMNNTLTDLEQAYSSRATWELEFSRLLGKAKIVENIHNSGLTIKEYFQSQWIKHCKEVDYPEYYEEAVPDFYDNL